MFLYTEVGFFFGGSFAQILQSSGLYVDMGLDLSPLPSKKAEMQVR